MGIDVGTLISHYSVVEHIGRGGMADVWSARDVRLNRTVAVKTILRDLSQDAEPLRLFQEEAKTIAELEHPHILPIYDVGEYDNQLYIVMRFVTGGSLEDLLERGPMGVHDTLKLGESIAKALDYAHSNKVIHLDLKPSNILLDSSGSPYLADFGLATRLGPEGRANNPGYGTLLYMAPEQLTETNIDHRADIYSFAILLFQMLTGELPFDATTSLALKQLQFQENLPDPDSVSPNLPADLAPILRRGTALLPEERPPTMMSLVNEMQEALSLTKAPTSELIIKVPSSPGLDQEEDQFAATLGPEQLITIVSPEVMAKREAEDIYNKARRNWAYGQGKFLLGVSHFMLINGYYMNAEQHGLEVDEAGMQMLLRGALEYDHEVDYWWEKLDVDNRRWVALHAVRSENAPARTRALYRLETLPDSEPLRIPTLVAQSLQVETDEAAKLAAVHVLGTRAQLFPRDQISIKNKPADKLLSEGTRLEIQHHAPTAWRDAVYTPEIDLLLAETALDDDFPDVAELSARMIGRVRSLTALREIAKQEHAHTKGALRALALIRDEAPSLPEVSNSGRFYAWIYNTQRRLAENPLGIVWRYVFALIGGALALGTHVFTIFRSQAVFLQMRWANSIAMGLTFGFIIGFFVLLASEFPERLRGFWPWWARLISSLIFGTLVGGLAWYSWGWLFLNLQPSLPVVLFAGFGMTLGFALGVVFKLRGWQSFLLTVVFTYLPLYITFQNYVNQTNWLGLPSEPVLYYDYMTYPDQIYTVGITVAVLIALGGHAKALWQDIQALRGKRK
jgi:hypothetical protein